MGFDKIVESIFLGVGLSMDAASVSMTDGMIERKMKIKKMLFIAILFGLFQGGMPLIGYFLSHLLTSLISSFAGGAENVKGIIEIITSIVGFIILAFLGIKMIIDGLKKDDDDEEEKNVKTTFGALIVQAIATSIDALTSGIAYANEKIGHAIVIFSIVIVVTSIICFFAIIIGKKFGEFFANYASIFGGIILFSIGVKILSNLLPILFIIYLILLINVLGVLFLILGIRHKTHKEKLFNSLLKSIESYETDLIQEQNDKETFINHLKEYKYKLFSRKNEKCHISSSAFVFNKDMDKVLFCYHKIYDSWSWLGGHADNEIDLISVAKKEINEETGLKNFEILFNEIVSLEILPVKKHMKKGKEVEEHLHFNITYAFVADENEELRINENENSAVKFLPIVSLDELVSEKHMLVIYNKIINRVKNKKIVTR